MNNPSRVLLHNSKNITKSDCSSPQKDETKVGKKYKTYSKTVKKQYLHELWKGLTQIFNLVDFEPKSEDLLKPFDQATIKQKNDLITDILTKHKESFTDGDLTNWRRTIKRWIKEMDKPETRGAPVVPAEKSDDFKEKVYEILDKIPFRSRPLLRSELIKVVRSYRESQSLDKPIGGNTCSEHWWFNYCNKNPDIRERWEVIPLERTAKSRSKGIVSGAVSTAGVSLETSPVREENQRVFGIFHEEMEEERLAKTQFTLFEQNNEFYAKEIKEFGYLLEQDFNVAQFDDGVDQFFANTSEDVQNQVYMQSPDYF